MTPKSLWKKETPQVSKVCMCVYADIVNLIKNIG